VPYRGYRVKRLRERRQARLQRWQLVALSVLAAVVSAAAVAGAYFVARSLTHRDKQPRASGYVALLTFGANRPGGQASAGIVVLDKARGSYDVFTVPRSLLLEGSAGEYVMAGDVMTSSSLRTDLERLIQAPIAHDLRFAYSALGELAGGPVTVALPRAATLKVDGTWRTYRGTFRASPGELGTLLGALGKSGADEDTVLTAVLAAVFHSGALRPAEERSAAVQALLADLSGVRRTAASETLAGLLAKRVQVTRLPSVGVVNEGQFAYRPDKARVMAEITRLTPGYASRYTVYVRNGTGEVGIGQLVLKRLAILDVNLPSPSNADTFDYKRTQIVAGSQALEVAEDIRAILGRGVVLSGDELPATSVVVIIGADLKTKDLQ
jgi:hypothetical protein